MASLTRLLEWIFFLYFFSHIPITLLVDLQAILPARLYPQELLDLMKWYVVNFKDHLMMNPPAWFMSFVYSEAILQLPFFPVASYAFFKGGCKWIRIPAIVYSAHVATTVIAIIAHVLFGDFPKSDQLEPLTQKDRLTLVSVYAPYLVIPLLLLVTMLFSPRYRQEEKRKRR
ncbi:sigma intracellular receptor 2 [Bombina bombina]|uniref:sigma intracellular receptor 2 n=1 Tax=Bombina bombina TaxID=8345 RepID=UPI00235A78B9|nr:sigma intracellular receptor 2 [Bombina bombina]XP_053562242.1 sigma intracellular receptor 2 [Bombina bombina]